MHQPVFTLPYTHSYTHAPHPHITHTLRQALAPPPLPPPFSLTLRFALIMEPVEDPSHTGREPEEDERGPDWREGGASDDLQPAQGLPGLQNIPVPNPRSPSTLPPTEGRLGGAHYEHLFGPAFGPAGSTAHLGGAPRVETWGRGGRPCALWRWRVAPPGPPPTPRNHAKAPDPPHPPPSPGVSVFSLEAEGFQQAQTQGSRNQDDREGSGVSES